MAFIAVYKDPKKKKLQQIEIALMVIFLPIGLYFGYGAYEKWDRFNRSEVHSARGQEFFHVGKVDEGLKEFKMAIELYPENPSYWESLGVAHHMKGAHKEEAASYLLGIQSNPESGNLHREYGTALHEIGEHEKELEFLKKAEKLGTNDDLFLSRLISRAEREADGTLEPSKAKAEGIVSDVPPALLEGSDGHDHSENDGHDHSEHDHSKDDGHGH